MPEGLLQRGGREPFIPYERRNDILHIIENMTFSLWAHKRCGSYRLTVCYIGSVVTQHIKSVACHNWLHLATCFGRYPAIVRPTRNSVVEVHSTSFSSAIPLFTLKTLSLENSILMIKMLLNVKLGNRDLDVRIIWDNLFWKDSVC